MTDILKLIDGDESCLPAINILRDGAEPYIEITCDGYEYLCMERGAEIFRKIPIDVNELMYFVFSDVTFFMTVKNPAESRRGRQIELLSKLSSKWAERFKLNN